jgi:thiamine biosynthesis lipoprotein
MATLQRYPFAFTAMSCRNELQIYAASAAAAEAAAAEAVAEVRRIERHWSRYRSDSLVSRINAAAGKEALAVDDETAALLDYADVAWRESNGRFDITCGVLRRAWNFSGSSLPTAAAVDALLPLVGWQRVSWQRPHFLLPQSGMEIDFGGLGKEYAADRAATLLAAHGLAALVNLGGDMVATAARPDDEPWQIGIRDPQQAGALAGRLPLYTGALATSGDYERCIVANGQRYGHILDPRSGWPLLDGPASVTVLAPTCLVAGTLATIGLLRGGDAEQWLQQTKAEHLVLWPQEKLQ